LKNNPDLDAKVEGYLKSLELTLFNRSYMTSYQCSLVTMALSCTIF